jgi:peptidoglycan/xylan/chitin deacetylase (PgdA/CDA1 family)
VHGPYADGETPLTVARKLIATFAGAHVPAYGMVNAHWSVDQPETVQALREWRGAGLELANHGWSHRHLNEMTLAEFEQEVARDEPLLEQLAGGTDWHWFRYPFLDEGKDEAQRSAARHILAQRGYKVAAVTMDFDDWQFTAPYARCTAANDKAAIARLEQMYLAAATDAIRYYRAAAHQLYGRDIPYVLLMHESAFEAHMLPRLLDLYRSAGFRFVSLADAEKDSAYADQVSPDLPAEPKGLESKVAVHGIHVPPRKEFSAELAAICPGGPTATIP